MPRHRCRRLSYSRLPFHRNRGTRRLCPVPHCRWRAHPLPCWWGTNRYLLPYRRYRWWWRLLTSGTCHRWLRTGWLTMPGDLLRQDRWWWLATMLNKHPMAGQRGRATGRMRRWASTTFDRYMDSYLSSPRRAWADNHHKLTILSR